MHKLPLVTIGIPTFNEENYIAETIESAINQTFIDIRILIADNHSTDNTYEIAKKYESIDPRVSVFRQKENVGPYLNFKYLLDNSDSEYFMWLGGHDVIKDNFIENAIPLFNNEIVCVYPYASHLKDNLFENTCIQDDIENVGLSLKERILLLCKNISYGNAVYGLYRRDILKKSHLTTHGGDLLILLMASYYGSFKCLKEISYFFRVVRNQENDDERLQRYKSYGFHKNWLFYRTAYPFFATYKFFKIPLIEKLRIMMDIKKPLQRDIKFSWIDLFKYFLLEKKEFVLAFYILIIFIYSKYKGYDL